MILHPAQHQWSMPSTSSHDPPSSPASVVNALHQQPWSSIESSISGQCPPPAAMVLHPVQNQQSRPSPKVEFHPIKFAAAEGLKVPDTEQGWTSCFIILCVHKRFSFCWLQRVLQHLQCVRQRPVDNHTDGW
ncbi:unnamed protein product [Xylocopa violacea]|uniref:Uncharacterized protein n=1 Tax=Xylocopa violacea TaxID=135666 RepID=A0ABP1N622_XYLVO